MCDLPIVRRQCSKPIAVGEPKKSAEPKIGVGGNRALPSGDNSNTLRWNADLLGQPVLRKAHGNKELVAKQFAGCDWLQSGHGLIIVIRGYDNCPRSNRYTRYIPLNLPP